MRSNGQLKKFIGENMRATCIVRVFRERGGGKPKGKEESPVIGVASEHQPLGECLAVQNTISLLFLFYAEGNEGERQLFRRPMMFLS